MDSVNFSGLRCPETRAMFVFDLDGTFAHGLNEDILKVLELKKKANAVLTYATGRTLKEVKNLQAKLEAKGIFLPTPDHLITNNGQFIYENIGGELVEDLNWQKQLRETTGFDRSKICRIMYDIAHRSEYAFNKTEYKKLLALDNFRQIKETDPDFWDSKISYYEWNASANMVEYFIAAGVDINKFKNTILAEFSKVGIKTKFIDNHYSKPIMDACRPSILLQSHQLRRHPDGSMSVLFLSPADKGDGIEYLGKKLNISRDEIVMAGNDNNDLSMASLVKNGSFFICVSNATEKLKDFANEIKRQIKGGMTNNVIFTTQEGVKGILEGLNKILQV